MGIFLNLILIVMSTIAFMCGISFHCREKNASSIRWYILVLSIACGLCCGGYGAMAFSVDMRLARFFRAIGLIGVDMYVFMEVLLFNFLLKKSVHVQAFWKIFYSFAIVLDLFFYGSGRSTSFIRYRHYTSLAKDPFSIDQMVHYGFMALAVFNLMILAVQWLRTEQYIRQRWFIKWLFLSNVCLLLGTLPDILVGSANVKFPTMAFSYSTFFSFLLIWYFAICDSGIAITVSNTSSRMFESVKVAVVVFDNERRLALSNSFANELLKINEVYGQRLSDLFQLSESDEIRTYKVLMEEEEVTNRWLSKDGEVICSVNLSLEKDLHNEPYGVICVVTDMTKEEKMIESVKAANEAKSSFLANMSHEIRTPINVVLGMDEMILRESQNPTIIGYAQDIENAGRSLLSIINDILDFSKIESGRMEIIPVEYSVSSMLSDSYNMILMRAKNKNLNLQLKCKENLPSVLLGDEVRIRQVLTNLLTNAVKYTPEGGEVSLEVDFGTVSEEVIELHIDVRDTGIGISDECKEDLFKSFQRIDQKRNRNIEGTGLGLSITKQLVDLMGGSIRVDSVYGQGSVFSVKLPQKVLDKTEIGEIHVNEREEQQRKKESQQFIAPEAQILVVDDMQMNLNVFCGLLKRTQIKVTAVLSGQEALNQVEEKAFDLIFMDHMMPGMDGIETFQEIKRRKPEKNANTPVIMLTANAIRGVEKQYKGVGFTDYLTKPIKSELLEKTIFGYLPKEKVQLLTEYPPSEDAVQEGMVEEKKEEVPNTPEASLEKLKKIEELDTETGLMYCATDVDFYLCMIQEYCQNNHIEELKNMYTAGDWENYQIIAHAVKSTSLMIGAVALSERAKEQEMALKEGRIEMVEYDHKGFMLQYEELIHQLKGCVAVNIEE